MATSFEEQVAQSVAKLREHQEQVSKVRRGLAKASESARSRDRSITAIVGGEGQLLEFRFHSEEFRTMPAAELSATLVQLANEARQKMARRVAESFEPLTRFGPQLRESMTGSAAMEDTLASLLEARGSTGAVDGQKDEEGSGG
jgi:hypothetical protein